MTTDQQTQTLYDGFLDYLRTGRAATGLFTPDVVATFHVPHGHYVCKTPGEMEHELQRFSSRGFEVTVKDSEETPRGFIIEFTQRIPGGLLYEEMAWVTVKDGGISAIQWYCTGEVQEQRQGVPLEAPGEAWVKDKVEGR